MIEKICRLSFTDEGLFSHIPLDGTLPPPAYHKKYGDFYTSYWSPYSLFNYMRATPLSLAACATASATTAPTSLFKALGII